MSDPGSTTGLAVVLWAIKDMLTRNFATTLALILADWLAVTGENGLVTLLDVATGKPTDEVAPELGLGATTTRTFADRFFYTSQRGLVGEVDSSGRPQWRSWERVGDITGMALGDQFLGITNREGDLFLFGLQSGEKDSGLQP